MLSIEYIEEMQKLKREFDKLSERLLKYEEALRLVAYSSFLSDKAELQLIAAITLELEGDKCYTSAKK